MAACWQCIILNHKYTVNTSSALVRSAKVAAGFALLPVGIVLLVLPGPGLLLIVTSLFLLEGEFRWAGKARETLLAITRRGVSWLQRAVR